MTKIVKPRHNKPAKLTSGIEVVFKKSDKKSTSITAIPRIREPSTPKKKIKLLVRGMVKALFFSLRQLKA